MFANFNYQDRSNCADRFIPRRSGKIDLDVSHYKINTIEDILMLKPNESDTKEEYLNFMKYHRNKCNYLKQLALCLLPSQKKILNFSTGNLDTLPSENYHNLLWPVIARKKPLLLERPAFILDMPGMNARLDGHVIDWGKKGYIASVFEREVHLWHPEEELKRQVTRTGRCVKNCVKWNQDGTKFAMALKNGKIAIISLNKLITSLECVCCGLCTIHTIDWTKDNLIVSGCANGKILITSLYGKKIRYVDRKIKIINLKLSCNDNYLVTSDLVEVVIWHFPSLQFIRRVKDVYPIRGVSWHPWKEPLLAIAGTERIYLFNVLDNIKLASLRHSRTYFVDEITFNPLTAELVVVYWLPDENESTCFITVYRNFKTVVDGLRFQSERIPYLLWDNTGTKLATAGADESLIIWNFFGTKQETKSLLNRLKSKTLSTSPIKTIALMGKGIR